MEKRKKLIIWLVGLGIMLAVFLVSRANSLTLALISAGIDTDQPIRNVEELAILSDREFKVIQGTTKDGKLALVQLLKDVTGRWTVMSIQTEQTKGQASVASSAWFTDAGTQRFAATDVPEFYCEWHCAVCGNDAQKWINIPPEDIPDNLTINIQQIGGFYLIHMISFEPEPINFDLVRYLAENGYIPN